MQNKSTIQLSLNSKTAVSSLFSEVQATALELCVAHAFTIGITTLYKNAIDALYDEHSARFYHNYSFPGPSELKSLLDNDELQRIHELPLADSLNDMFADPKFLGIKAIGLSDLGGYKFMQTGDFFQICIHSFRANLLRLDLDSIFASLHDQAFFYIFPDEYDELSDEEHDMLMNWLDYYSKLHWNRTKYDISQFVIDWIFEQANLNGIQNSEANNPKLRSLGISERIFIAANNVKYGKNPIAVLTPILSTQKPDIVPISAVSIQYV